MPPLTKMIGCDMMKSEFVVGNMTCSACANNIEKNVKKIDGVEKVDVFLMTNSMIVEYNEKVEIENIINKVNKLGYTASVINNKKNIYKEKGNTLSKEKDSTLSQEKDNTLSQDKNILSQDRKRENNNTLSENIKREVDKKKKIISSVIILIPLMYISMGKMIGLPEPSFLVGDKNSISLAFTQFLLALCVIFINKDYIIRGLRNLFLLTPNMDTLVAIGSVASMLYGVFVIYGIGYALGDGNMTKVNEYSHNLYFESAAMILVVISIGKYLESKARSKTGEEINKLMSLIPNNHFVLKIIDGVEVEESICIDDIKVDDIVVIRPGQNIGIDGVVVEGNTSIDESAISGESLPVNKSVGDTITSGTLNNDGYIKVRVVKEAKNSTISGIIDLVIKTINSKAPIARLADKVSGIFVPIVMILALVTMIIWLLIGKDFEFALSMGISVLVVSCPCALGLATPTAIMVGSEVGAKIGVLFKDATSLEIAHKIDNVVFDKTGTITKGELSVTDIVLLNDKYSENDVLKLAASIENMSEHPYAKAILDKAKKENLALYKTSDFVMDYGKGIRGCVYVDENVCTKKSICNIICGNALYLKDNNINIYDNDFIMSKQNDIANDAKTPIFVALIDESGGEVIGIIALQDEIKESSIEAIKKLEKMNIKVTMLTGDNEITAKAVAKKVGIENVYAQVTPIDKEKYIRKLQNKSSVVAMVGDGINDAPSLVSADVGIAIGAGSDIAIESADVVVIKNDLLDLVTAIRLSKATIRNIKQNLFWAFFYNVCGIPIAAGVFYNFCGLKLNPMICAIAMSFSSVFVVSNALRLRKFKNKINENDKIKESDKANENDKIKESDKANENDKIKESDKVKDILRKEEKNMIMIIDGMMCNHCTGRVHDALMKVDGVSEVVMNLEEKSATVTIEENATVTSEQLKSVVENEGYKVIEIK